MNATAVDVRELTNGLFVVASAPAGWYEIGNATRRWFDGRRWTDHYAPVLVAVIERDVERDAEQAHRSVNHGFHLIMTIMTLTAWLPVWGVVATVRVIRPRHDG